MYYKLQQNLVVLTFAHTSCFYFTNRLMSFDLEISGALRNGSCYPLSEGNVVLSYRIGTGRQWKTIEVYASVGKQDLANA